MSAHSFGSCCNFQHSNEPNSLATAKLHFLRHAVTTIIPGPSLIFSVFSRCCSPVSVPHCMNIPKKLCNSHATLSSQKGDYKTGESDYSTWKESS